MATKRSTPVKAKRKAPAPKPAAKKRNVVKAKAQAKAPTPRPLEDDEIELSGVFGRVRYRESDPFAEVREIYDHYDRDKDGLISAGEFARVLEAFGMELEQHELKVALLDVDRDGDNKIAWDEFLAWWRSMRA